jgi:hypothetical protein
MLYREIIAVFFSEIRTKRTNSYTVWAEDVELLGALAKFARLPLDGFLFDVIFEYFSKICRGYYFF